MLKKIKKAYLQNKKLSYGIIVFLLVLVGGISIFVYQSQDVDTGPIGQIDVDEVGQTDKINYVQDMQEFLEKNTDRLSFNLQRQEGLILIKGSCKVDELDAEEMDSFVRNFLEKELPEKQVNKIISEKGEDYRLVVNRMKDDCNIDRNVIRDKGVIVRNNPQAIEFEEILPGSYIKYFGEFITINNIKKVDEYNRIDRLSEVQQDRLVQEYKKELEKIESVFNYELGFQVLDNLKLYERLYWDQEIEFESMRFPSVREVLDTVIVPDNQAISEQDLKDYQNFKQTYDFYYKG